MSVTGLRPVVEIMFSDFLPTAGDAIVEELPKFRFMTGGQCTLPVTVRSIGGGGGRFGTQHSATGESWFMAFPGLLVATAGTAARRVLGAPRGDPPPPTPCSSSSTRRSTRAKASSSEATAAIAEIGKAATVRQGSDLTIVATLLMVDRALEAAELLAAEGIEAEVIDLRWLRPLDLPTVRESVEQTGRLLIAEEQVHAGGWGATVISQLTLEGVHLAAPPRVVGLRDDVLIPYSPPLEDALIPSADAIVDASRALVRD